MHIRQSGWTPHRRGIAALLATVAIWGTAYIITKAALDEIGPFTIAVVRFSLALAIIWPLARRQGFRALMMIQPAFVRFGLTGVALYFGLQNLGLVWTSAGVTALIQTAIPAVTAVLAVLLLHERLNRFQIIGIAVTIAGTVLVSWSGDGDGSSQALLGNIMIIGSTVAWAIYTIQGRRMMLGIPPLVATAASFGAGLLFLTPLMLLEIWRFGLPQFSPAIGVSMIYLGIVSSALTMFLWNYALQYIEASVAGLYVNLTPVVGLIAALVGGERTSTSQIAGGSIALFGVWLSTRGRGGRR